MKITLFFIVFLNFFFQTSAKASLYDEAEECLLSLRKMDDVNTRYVNAQKCFEKARFFSDKLNMRGRSIYLMFINEIDQIAYKSRIIDYYNKEIRNHLGENKIISFDTPTLLTLFDALLMVSFVKKDEETVSQLSFVFNELLKRGQVNDQHWLRLFEEYVHIRHFVAAENIRQRHPLPEMEYLPALEKNIELKFSDASFLDISTDKKKMTVRKIDLNSEVKIIVTILLGCGFAKKSLKIIADDRILKNIFSRNGVFLNFNGRIDANEIISWNTIHPELQIYPIYNELGWFNVEFKSSPTFFFLKKGMIKYQTVNGSKEEIVKGLNAIGIL